MLVNVLPGTYVLTERLSPKSNQWVVSTGGSSVTFINWGSNAAFTVMGSSAAPITNTTIKGFTFTNQAIGLNVGYVIAYQFGTNAVVDDCVFSNLSYGNPRGTAIRVGLGSSALVQNSIFENMTASAGNSICGIWANSNPATVTVQNCRFSNINCSGLLGGAVCVSNAGSSATITGSKFIGNVAAVNMKGGSIALPLLSGSLNASGNTFYTLPSPHKTFACSTLTVPTTLFSVASNNYCGSTNADSSCNLGAPFFSPADYCGVCGGNDSDMNCIGQCFKPAPPQCPAPVTRFVAPAALGTGDGSSAANAMGSIQAAIDASSFGDIVSLLAGTYSISSPILFNGKAVTVTGNPSNPSCVVVDCGGATTVAFQSLNGESLYSKLSSLTVRHCGSAFTSTGFASSITIDNIVVDSTNNGAITFRGRGRVSNSLFINNLGTAIISANPGATRWSVNVTNCRFVNNNATFGVFWGLNVMADMTNNVLVNNSALAGTYGGFFYDSGTYGTLTGNTMTNTGTFANSAGSAIYCLSGLTLGAGNVMCNGGTTPVSCPSISSVPAGTAGDCGVCNGPAQSTQRDCSGVCFGTGFFDTLGTSCATC